MRNVWDIPVTPPREKRHGKHPAQKAEEVLKRIILAGTNEGDLILDCFAGAGSTAVVAERLGRRWVLIEKERKFNQIAKKRLEEAPTAT
jgi:DNA modification methylase